MVLVRSIVLLCMSILIIGCASYLPFGQLYTGGKMGIHANNITPEKKGSACMTSILGLVATGDASIRAAMIAAGITQVSTIDYEVENIFGIYGKYCTVITGR